MLCKFPEYLKLLFRVVHRYVKDGNMCKFILRRFSVAKLTRNRRSSEIQITLSNFHFRY
ncbi:hypothetical protein F383_24300 [Gossypium arboreum]|uniref:Uncharacterized protein n=1 Tax=Gossypium arboreum TaxID=29729 RepID=A0A0B0MPA0_GOSAR|nr:hypothetical protein F383_24300 [Gossypium arboreum]